jgi:hypothetical protein
MFWAYQEIPRVPTRSLCLVLNKAWTLTAALSYHTVLSFTMKHERRESHEEAFKVWPLHLLDLFLVAAATTRK